jgi:hypothetical protein
MKASFVRPQTKFAAALMAAGVVTAASIVGVPENRSLPVLNIDVANASVITDALVGLGGAVDDVAYGVALTLDGAFSLPFDASATVALAVQNPSLGPSLLSWLVQLYANPADAFPYITYPWLFKVNTIEPLAALLPYPLGPNGVDDGLITNAVNQLADAIGNALAGLPSPGPGVLATQEFWDSDIGRTVLAANYAVTAPAWMLYDTALYLGYLPASLEATFESAIQNPSEIAGLVSNLVNGLLSPTSGLLGNLLDDASLPVTTLPGPIGEGAANVVTAISDSIDNLLSLLPPPISPTPFPSAAQSVQVADVQDASPAAAGDTALLSADPIEKKDSTDNTPPATPKDSAPAAGDVDQDATPAADTNAPEVKTHKPVTNTVKSGNKVRPGDKFDSHVKGEKAGDAGDKDSGTGTTATPPGSGDAPAGGTAAPTEPQAGGTDGADSSAPSDGSGAAA